MLHNTMLAFGTMFTVRQTLWKRERARAGAGDGAGARYSRVPSKRVAIVSRKVFCGASSPLITGILLRVERLLAARLDSCCRCCSAPKPDRNREVPGAHPSPCRSAPIREPRPSSVAAVAGQRACQPPQGK